MNSKYLLLIALIVVFSCCNAAHGYNEGERVLLRVGGGEAYQSIQQAIDDSANMKNVVILVAAGVYEEKLFITRNNLAIVGMSAEKTIVQKPILRSEWRINNSTDWGAAVVNINGSHISLVNLTVVNNYGRQHGSDEHQFAVRGFELSDHIITHNCRFVADGSDTLSLWNKHGRYYHSHCRFEGYTDMVCPRGTALIEHSSFFNNKRSATLWHDGELSHDYKLVVNQSVFDGKEGFLLGRHHYDAQFYILNSQFSERMADVPLFKKRYPENPQRDRANLWGQRYFFQSNISAKLPAWAKDNFRLEDLVPSAYPSIEQWVFAGEWSPKDDLKSLEQFLSQHTQLSSIQAFNF